MLVWAYTSIFYRCSMALPFTYFNLLYFIQGLSEESGQVVRMIIGILVKIKTFIVILVAMIVGERKTRVG